MPDQSEAMVIVDENDRVAQDALDAATRAYYEQGASDGDDDAWGKTTA